MSDYIKDIHKELYEVSKAGNCARVRELLEAGADPTNIKIKKVTLLSRGLLCLVTMKW